MNEQSKPIDAAPVHPTCSALRAHGETLGRAGKPASRQLLIDAADEIDRLRACLRGVLTGDWSPTGIQEVLGDLNDRG